MSTEESGTVTLNGRFTLTGRYVHLVPMELDHVDGLVAAAGGDRSTFGYTTVPWDRPTMTEYVTRAMAKRDQGEHVPFVTWSVAHGRIVGTTRFYDLTPWDWGPEPTAHQRVGRPDVASIGYTWLDPAAQRTPVNSEAKLLMLTHAFETWEVWAVRLKTDARNERSRRAIERLGFRLDGVIRADMPGTDDTVRDSAVFSMLASEWPDHRERLTAGLAAGR
jgi:RimJ/RimL family protein N-acetyltransferase